jgi:hypothetical protein
VSLSRIFDEVRSTAQAIDGTSGPVVTLSTGPARVRVRCADATLRNTLLNTVQPAMHLADPAPEASHQDVHVLIDHDLARRLDRFLASTGPGQTEPHVNTHGVHLVGKRAQPPPAGPTGYLLWRQEDPATSWVVLADVTRQAHTALLRLVRAITARVLLAEGWIPLHAACITTDAGAICLLGDRQHGKTTALLYLLNGAAGPVSLVANSIVFLAPDNTRQACTLPTAIGIRPGSLSLFPTLQHLKSNTGTRPRLYLPAARLANLFGVPQSHGGPLAAFITVRYRSSTPASWRPIPPADRYTSLTRGCLPDDLPDDPHEYVRLPHDHARQRPEILHRYALSTPAVAITTGTDTDKALHDAVRSLTNHTT